MKHILALIIGLSGSLAFANHHEKMEPMSKEERETMAKAHEAMATCLRSDKEMKTCHEELKTSCQSLGDKCPMNHHGHMGKMHGKKMGEMKEPAAKK